MKSVPAATAPRMAFSAPLGPAAAHAQRADLSGPWAFNAAQSDNAWARTEPGDTSGGAQRAGGGGGRRGGYGGGGGGGLGGGSGGREGGGGGVRGEETRAAGHNTADPVSHPPPTNQPAERSTHGAHARTAA